MVPSYLFLQTSPALVGSRVQKRLEKPTLKQTGFLYAIILLIILSFQVLAISLFWVIYSSLSILLTERDYKGLFYPRALKHLLIGLYLMQVCLVALFLLVRDSQGNARCIG